MIKIKGITFSVLLVIVFLLIPSSAWATTYLVFRYDDLSADAPGERENNPKRQEIWEAEQAVDGLFHKFGFPYVIAVIPKRNEISLAEDTDKVEFINRAIQVGRMEVAQHGFVHINHARENHRSGEFRERSYKDQFNDIRQGKDILCRCLNLKNIETFVPPFNGWDENTARAIKKLCFSILSADRSYYDSAISKLTIIPFTAQLWELESKVNQNELTKDAIVVVLFHPSQIVREEGKEDRYYGIKRFEKLLQKLSAMQNVNIVTLQELAAKCNDLSINRYQVANSLYQQRSFWSKLLPQSLCPGETDWYLYSSAQRYEIQVVYWRILTIGLITGSLLGGLVVRHLIGALFSTKLVLMIEIFASMLFLLAVLKGIQIVYKGFYVTGLPVVAASFSVIFLVALVSVLLKKPRSGKLPDEHQSEIGYIKHND